MEPALTFPPDATAFLTLSYGGLTVTARLTPAALAQIQSGQVVTVTLYDAMSGDVSAGDWRATFIGGELASFLAE